MRYRICERFGQPPSWFATLGREHQVELLAYESVRDATHESE